MAARTMPVSSCPALRRDSCFLGGAHGVASGGTEHKLTHPPAVFCGFAQPLAHTGCSASVFEQMNTQVKGKK